MTTKSKLALKKNLILIFIVIGLIVMPLWLVKDHDFSGTDDKASQAIIELNQDYKPWFQPLWHPPSKEIENLLFSLQAAIGAGFIGYYIGLSKGKFKK